MKLAVKPAQLNDIETIPDFMVGYYKIEGVEFNRIKSGTSPTLDNNHTMTQISFD
jgi:hypothetical protein